MRRRAAGAAAALLVAGCAQSASNYNYTQRPEATRDATRRDNLHSSLWVYRASSRSDPLGAELTEHSCGGEGRVREENDVHEQQARDANASGELSVLSTALSSSLRIRYTVYSSVDWRGAKAEAEAEAYFAADVLERRLEVGEHLQRALAADVRRRQRLRLPREEELAVARQVAQALALALLRRLRRAARRLRSACVPRRQRRRGGRRGVGAGGDGEQLVLELLIPVVLG